MTFKRKKTRRDGILFDSKGEADRYSELKLLERSGTIYDLKCQVTFPLIPGFSLRKRNIRPMTYTPDFTYIKEGKKYAEDFKGRSTEPYRMRKKLFLYFHGEEWIFVESSRSKKSFKELIY